MTDKQNNQSLVVAQPAQQLDQFGDRKKSMREFVKSQIKEEIDYGVIPGTKKKTLLQPGAEKLANLYTLIPVFELTKEIEDWEKGFFYYRYLCKLSYNVPLTREGENGNLEVYDAKTVPAGEAERSCNSREKKYLYTTVAERFATDAQKETYVSKFTRQERGYTNTYLKVKNSPEEAADNANTVQSMAQKRALVAAVRTATMASDIFLEEVSDVEPGATNQEKDYTRVNQIKKLHAVAHPRGFNEERLHTAIDALYHVDSITKLTGQQIADLTEKLQISYDVVGENNYPKRISGKPNGLVKPEKSKETVEPADLSPTKISDVNKPKEEEDIVEAAEEIFGSNPEDGRMCAQCHEKPAKENGFCSTECQDKYYPPKKDLTFTQRQQKLVGGAKGGATT